MADGEDFCATKDEEKLSFHTITSYSWEDDGPIVKVHISLDAIGALPAERIGCRFGEQTVEQSFTLEIRDYKGQNWRLQVPKLSETIDLRESKLIIKQDRLIVKLVKQNPDTHWFDLFKTKGIGGD